MNENTGEEFAAIVDELLDILHQPDLPSDHPDAAGQQLEKSEAQAVLDDIRTRLLPPLTKRALSRLHKLIELPAPPRSDPNAADFAEVKRRARIILLKWNAHYGPGGPYKALSLMQDDGRSQKGGRYREVARRWYGLPSWLRPRQPFHVYRRSGLSLWRASSNIRTYAPYVFSNSTTVLLF